MPYTIRVFEGSNGQAVLDLLRKKAEGQFTFDPQLIAGRLRGKQYTGIEFRFIRLVEPKSYCGQHPGECFVGPLGERKKPNNRLLEWDDWVQFHSLVNDVLDELRAKADVFSFPQDVRGKMWIRKVELGRRFRYEWEDDWSRGSWRPIQHWNQGTPDQFVPEVTS